MSYTPRKKRDRLSYKIILPLLIGCIFIAFFLVRLMKDQEVEKKELFSVCGFSNEKSEKILKKEHKDVSEAKDYLFYGESLGIYQDIYTGENNDGFNAKTMKLKNICNDKEYSFSMDKAADRRILLGNLEPGFYEIYVVEDLKERRVYMHTSVNTTMHAVTRNQKNMRIQFLADKELLKDYDVTTNYAYAYLSVSESELEEDEYDVVLDPSANDSGITVDYGSVSGVEGHNLIEANESYEAAKLLKTKLEEKGLKVLILREKDEIVPTYGEDGRLFKAYDVKAKYYFRLAFADDKTSANTKGFTIFYSSHSTGMLASQIGYDFERNTSLKGNTLYMSVFDSTKGVSRSGVNEGELDKRPVYDSDMYIREVGGKATQAGMYSENSKTGTATFSKDNLNGIHALNIYFCYVSNESDATYWKSHKEEMIDSLAKSIAVYLDIE